MLMVIFGASGSSESYPFSPPEARESLDDRLPLGCELFAADGWARCGAGARAFPEDQIQLIGIEARVFDDLADLETERQSWVVRTSLLSHPILGAARQVGISISGVSQIWPEVVQLGNSVPGGASRRRQRITGTAPAARVF